MNSIHVVFGAAAIAVGLVSAPAATAAPDAHIPNPVTGYCPGGGMGTLYEGYCDGAPFPDGSYWHHINYGMPWMGTTPGAPGSPLTWCVINPDGGPLPQPAPPGGCGGAQQ